MTDFLLFFSKASGSGVKSCLCAEKRAHTDLWEVTRWKRTVFLLSEWSAYRDDG